MPRVAKILICVLMAAMFPAASRGQAADRYYVIVMAAQGEPDLPRTAHTFATFIHTTGPSNDNSQAKVESRTISWMPASLVIALRMLPEPGKNLDLPATLEWARTEGARVTAWGPYEIRPELYQLALKQISRLESGTLSYRMVDGRLRSVRASNCIHAVCDLAPGTLLNTGMAYGEEASAMIARHFKPWVVHPERKYDWLLDRLELSDYPVHMAP